MRKQPQEDPLIPLRTASSLLKVPCATIESLVTQAGRELAGTAPKLRVRRSDLWSVMEKLIVDVNPWIPKNIREDGYDWAWFTELDWRERTGSRPPQLMPLRTAAARLQVRIKDLGAMLGCRYHPVFEFPQGFRVVVDDVNEFLMDKVWDPDLTTLQEKAHRGDKEAGAALTKLRPVYETDIKVPQLVKLRVAGRLLGSRGPTLREVFLERGHRVYMLPGLARYGAGSYAKFRIRQDDIQRYLGDPKWNLRAAKARDKALRLEEGL